MTIKNKIECPECGSQNDITVHGSSITLMTSHSKVIIDGMIHIHDPNKITTGFSCACDKNWYIEHYAECSECSYQYAEERVIQ